jgi:RimJ/RimL family protein N-acetyltransferase
VGERLYLRALDEGDVNDEYLGWLNDPEVTRYLESGKYPTTLAELRAFVQRFAESRDHLLFAIVDRASDAHVGNVTLNHINRIHRTADTGLMLGRKDFWGKGYAREAWALVIDYAFHRLNLRKVVAGVVAGNTASLATLRGLGFQVEGTLRGEIYVDGGYRDGIRLGLFREEFRPARGDAAAR